MGAYTREELADLYGRRVDMVYQICLMLMKNVPDAEDACQTVFRKVMECREPFRDPEHEKAWLIVTARNECKNQLKHWWRTARGSEAELEQLCWEQPEDAELWEFLLGLPEPERMAIYLHYYQGYTTGEAARMMGVRPATLRSRLFRGRNHLKTILEANGYGR